MPANIVFIYIIDTSIYPCFKNIHYCMSLMRMKSIHAFITLHDSIYV